MFSPIYMGPGLKKKLNFPLLQLEPVGKAPSAARCEVSLFHLFPLYKLQALPVTYAAFPNTGGGQTWRGDLANFIFTIRVEHRIFEDMKHALYFLAWLRNSFQETSKTYRMSSEGIYRPWGTEIFPTSPLHVGSFQTLRARLGRHRSLACIHA